jgi:hypothetical protein
MISSREDALLLLNKWKSDACVISFAFIGVEPLDRVYLWGFVTTVSEDSATISSAKDGLFSVSIMLLGNSFSYGDPREASTPKERINLETKYICGFAYKLPTGGQCLFAELRM